jgi:hypothetical protein
MATYIKPTHLLKTKSGEKHEVYFDGACWKSPDLNWIPSTAIHSLIPLEESKEEEGLPKAGEMIEVRDEYDREWDQRKFIGLHAKTGVWCEHSETYDTAILWKYWRPLTKPTQEAEKEADNSLVYPNTNQFLQAQAERYSKNCAMSDDYCKSHLMLDCPDCKPISPLTFDYKQAAVYWGMGKKVQYGLVNANEEFVWKDYDHDHYNICFSKHYKYRLAPEPVKELVVQKLYEVLIIDDGEQATDGLYTSLERAKKLYPNALAYLEIVFEDGKPKSSKIIEKGEDA